MNIFEKLRILDMSLSPEPTSEWSVLDITGKRCWFGSTPKEAVNKAYKEVILNKENINL